MDRIEDCISFLLGKAAQQVSRRARERLAPFGVTPVQYAVLNVLCEQDGLSGAELGVRLNLDSATVTGVVDRLEVAGLVDRKRHSNDRRVQRLMLTRVARENQPKLDRAMDDLNAEVESEMTPDEHRAFRAALCNLARFNS